MSTGGSKKPKKKGGFGAAFNYYMSLPSRWLAERSERKRLRRQRDRSDNIPNISLGSRIGRTIAWPFVSAGELIGGFFGGIGRYATTRNGMYLLQGIPSLVVLVGTIALAVVALSTKKEDLIREYKEQGDKALKEATKENGKITDTTRQFLLSRAQLCYERWMMLDNNNEEAKFDHAKASFEAEKNRKVPGSEQQSNDAALSEMRRLAPHFEPGGYKQAHDWLADFYMKQAGETKDPLKQKEFRDLAEVHLMRVLISDPEDTKSHFLLANLYLQTMHLEKALSHLLVAEKYDKGVNFELAKIYESMSQPGNAAQRAQMAFAHLKAQLDQNPDDLKTRLRLADVCVMLKDYKTAIDILQDGEKLTGGSKQINQKWAEILLKAMLELPSDDLAGRMDYLDQAIQVDPGNEQAFRYLTRYLREANPLKAVAQDKIDEAIAKSNSSSLHLLLSDYYLGNGQNELAQKHLEAVLRAQPQSLPVMNNLATVYAMAKPTPDFNRAMDLINACIKFGLEMNIAPANMAYFYDTRGQIYTAQRRWAEAAADLEKAVGYGLSDNINTRSALLRCYQELGKKSLAEEEARVIAQMKKKQTDGGAGATAAPQKPQG